ncbi:aliphatic sulfonate ABC transporter ATP-binding protein [Amycolatopsis sp. NBRC 101858]|uniref:ABC transporter ATP-binding protein n=1 Tax=Amycolatopsis sp. NBRC 101858 TaxID=3032200 RepID=UPI0024A4F6B8|nr:ABC transporter ATP-binding protein [Amycolatopsis sp. NBRC 101858]GLY43138.1 aliphatic sulfonate ABC transporter ATP-binding protein [Amycolatopsis sp. NBRC 101858]
MTTAVRVRGLTKSFGDRTVLSGLDLDIAPGEFVALIGESGCGKTTLLRLLAGLDAAGGGELEAPAERMVVFQEHRLLPWRRVWQNVAVGLPRAAAARALAEVGLAGHLDAWPVTLSGGEAQRVALARALVREPRLLLLDEPFAALDALTRIKMHALVRQLVAAHRPAVLLVTHDVDEAILLADRVVALREGRLAADHRVDFDGERSRRNPAFDELRHRLLAELGVAELAETR